MMKVAIIVCGFDFIYEETIPRLSKHYDQNLKQSFSQTLIASGIIEKAKMDKMLQTLMKESKNFTTIQITSTIY